MFEKFRRGREEHVTDNQEPQPKQVTIRPSVQNTLCLGCEECPNSREIPIPEGVSMGLPVLRLPLRLISNVKIEVDYNGASQESLEPGGTVDFYDEGCLNAGAICTHESEIQKIYDIITLSPRFLDQQLGLNVPEDEAREP